MSNTFINEIVNDKKTIYNEIINFIEIKEDIKNMFIKYVDENYKEEEILNFLNTIENITDFVVDLLKNQFQKNIKTNESILLNLLEKLKINTLKDDSPYFTENIKNFNHLLLNKNVYPITNFLNLKDFINFINDEFKLKKSSINLTD
jgi:hypothetical protein